MRPSHGDYFLGVERSGSKRPSPLWLSGMALVGMIAVVATAGLAADWPTWRGDLRQTAFRMDGLIHG
jgi:hypothetical protein